MSYNILFLNTSKFVLLLYKDFTFQVNIYAYNTYALKVSTIILY